ncbi:MAG: BatD family protein [Bacteroidales bacterium]|nr:BatD family protein [Bacteroidales bacterium]
MKRIITALIVALYATAAFAQTSISVDAHKVVGVDERFNVVFEVEGENSPSNFTWSPGDDFQLVWGPQKGTSSSVSIVNGKVSKSSKSSFTYILLPKKTGTFTLPAATATVKGETISSKSITIQVVQNGAGQSSGSSSSSGGSGSSSSGSGSSSSREAASGEDVFMRLNLSKTNVVVGEPITATLSLYQRANIVGFENARFPSFDGFWSQETETPSNIEFHRESLGDNIYNAAVLRRYVIIPQKSGNMTIDPAEIVCLINVLRPGRSSGSIFDSFFGEEYVTVKKRVSTRAVTVKVSPLPAGAPASFSGGVGNYSISARLSKDSLKVHDAASLIVTVSGKGNVSLIEAPKLSFPPDFETYDVKTTQNTDKSGTTGSKTFEYPFIPRSYGDFTLPPLKYSYYDVNSKKYATVSTDSLRIKVAKGNQTATTTLEPGQNQLTVDRKGVKNLGEDIRFIRTKAPSFTEDKGFLVGRPLYWIILALLALAAFAIWLTMRKAAAMRADVRGTKNRKATKMALKRLKLAGEFMSKGLQTAFYEELHRALLGFVSDKLSMDMAEQNKENIAAALASRGISEGLANEFTDLLDACEYARYAPSTGSEQMSAHYEKAVDVITAIDSNMKKTTSSPGAAAFLIAFALMIPSLSKAEPMSYPDSLWNEGVAAYSAGRWNDAAVAWEGIYDAGIRGSELYYNLASAYFKLGETGKAILFYERALKEDPSDKDVRYNLEFARGMTQDRIEDVPEFILKTWIKKATYLFSSDLWAVLSILFFAGALALLLLFLLGSSSGARRTGFFTGIAALLIAVFCFASASSQRADASRKDEAIVMRPVSSVKSSPSSDSAKDLFILHEGTKVKILDEVDLWMNIELSDGRQGWIATKDIEII